ncbi:phage tail protein [Mechercharimyces sp. CAU 1602]|uniref:phage tail protein n=1 Tax=Mechercharimyces sp. CAU 1602 TaxID=2973933 RepID=UPI0021610E65|nr:phage tail protein [Mechercharimyces sp. CAU 1602]MCS1350327.1 phage tail protein [Mechercharimyces sp. CAU 1602]
MDKLWIINRSTEKALAVLTNSSNKSCTFFNAVHRESINEFEQLEFSIDATHEDSEYVIEKNFVCFRDLDGLYRLFIIQDIQETHDSIKTKKVICESAASELLGEPVEDITISNGTAEYALDRILSGTRWQVGTVDNLGEHDDRFYRGNVIRWINRILEIWGGEVRFRVTIANNRITGRYVDIVSQLGNSVRKRFEYGKDVQQIEKKVDAKSVVTALYGYGKSDRDENDNETYVTLENSEWSVDNGDPTDKPTGQSWVGDSDARDAWGMPNGDGTYRHIFGEFTDSDIEDPEELLQATWDELQKRKEPLVEYTATVVDLERAYGEDYSHEAIRLGDVVFVIDREFAPELRAEARVIGVERHLDRPQDTVVTIGNFLPKMADDSAKLRDVERRVGEKIGVTDPIRTSWLSGALDAINNEIYAGGGTVVTTNDGINILDKPLDHNPSKSILMNNGIVAVSNQKVNGDFVYEDALTGDGIVASVIRSGTMLSDRIRGGTFYVGGTIEGVGQNGVLYLLDDKNEIVTTLSAEQQGFSKLYVGELSGENVVVKGSEDKTIYVDPSSGSNEKDGSSWENAYQSLQQAIDENVKEVNIGRITFRIKSGTTVDEEIVLDNIIGPGRLDFDFQDDSTNLYGYFRVASCLNRIYIYDGTFTHSGSTHPNDGKPYSVIRTLMTNWVSINRTKIQGDGKCDYGIASEGANIVVSDCEIYDVNSGCLYATIGGHIASMNNIGSGGYGARATNTGTICGWGTYPSGSTANIHATSGARIWLTGSADDGSGGGSYDPQPVTYTWSQKDSLSWDSKWGWNTWDPNEVTQGDPGSWGDAGLHRGCWFFDYNDIRSKLAGKMITSVKFYARRQSRGGYSASRPVYFCTHDRSSASGTPSMSGATNAGSFKWGDKKWVTLPKSFGERLRDGDAKGIGIYTSNASNYYYVLMEEACTLKITCE